MVKLQCKDYGFECDFVVEGKEATTVIEGFAKHTEEEHGIEYSKESLMQFIMRKGWKYFNELSSDVMIILLICSKSI